MFVLAQVDFPLVKKGLSHGVCSWRRFFGAGAASVGLQSGAGCSCGVVALLAGWGVLGGGGVEKVGLWLTGELLLLRLLSRWGGGGGLLSVMRWWPCSRSSVFSLAASAAGEVGGRFVVHGSVD